MGFKKWIQVLFSGALSFDELTPLGTKEYPHSEMRSITLEYFPLLSDMGDLEGVVVVASDITTLIEAQRLSEQEKNHSKLIINLIQNKKNIGRFIRESKALISEMHSTLTVSPANMDAESLFRQIHTLKGSAGILSIQEMIESCHHAETLLQKFKENPTARTLQELQVEAQIVDSNFSNFVKKSEEILGLAALSSERQIEIPISKLKQTLAKAESPDTPMTDLILNDFILEPIGSFFSSFDHAALQMAKKTDKLINPIELCNADLKILPEAYSGLFSSFIHAIGNAIDHGIEAPAVRDLNNKPAAGNIIISFERSKNNRLTILVQDDGAGIDPEKIRQRLNSKGIKNSHESDSEVIQHIFDSQFSTREQVTMLSGRGVGMDAIKHAAEELGGMAWVTSECKKGTSLFVEVPFINTFKYKNIKLVA
jgi:two-component system chemotaxis sensor kinase CheA